MSTYLPATAIIMEYFHRGKKFILPLYICSLVFYNYYNAYLCIIFAFFLLLIHYAIDYKKENKNFALEFGSFCLLGITILVYHSGFWRGKTLALDW